MLPLFFGTPASVSRQRDSPRRALQGVPSEVWTTRAAAGFRGRWVRKVARLHGRRPPDPRAGPPISAVRGRNADRRRADPMRSNRTKSMRCAHGISASTVSTSRMRPIRQITPEFPGGTSDDNPRQVFVSHAMFPGHTATTSGENASCNKGVGAGKPNRSLIAHDAAPNFCLARALPSPRGGRCSAP